MFQSRSIFSRVLAVLFILTLLTGALGIKPAQAASTPTYTIVRVGFWRACGLTASGTLRCWGYNASGELGDGTSVYRATAVDVVGLPGPVTDFAMGTHHTCALTTAGDVYCWGWNYYGQLGNGTTTSSPVPVKVTGFDPNYPSIRAISSNGHHTCAIQDFGNRLYCWGRNNDGQVGIGFRSQAETKPKAVLGVSAGIKSVAAGFAHTCAITTRSYPQQLVCWGRYFSGQLGYVPDGSSSTDPTQPHYVTSYKTSVSALSAGYEHTCAISTAGGLSCWGGGGYGQLGNGAFTNSTNPVAVTGLSSGVSEVTAGWWQTCARLTSGAVKCWGINDYGQVGDGSTANRGTPVTVQSLPGSDATLVSSGFRQTCAKGSSGWTRCWGDGGFGQLDNGLTITRSHPRDIVGLPSGIVSISTGYGHVCAVDSSGVARCWGNNDQGQSGGGEIKLALPQAVSGAYTQIAASDAGYYDDKPAHTCALTSAGGVVCWGSNESGQLGNGSLTSGVTAISAGKQHTCALLSSGTVKCWGNNASGQLGNGTTANSTAPVPVSGLSGVTAISAGSLHTCALISGGTVKCWGNNSAGQLGDGTTTNRTTPVLVSGISGAVNVSAGGGHTCAVLSDGSVSCWGNNSYGQLSNGSTMIQSETVEPLPAGLEEGEGIPEGCVLLPGGGMTCLNDPGIQSADLGLTATAVSGLSAPAISISAGYSHTCALLQGSQGGMVQCWGDNRRGQLGDGTLTKRTSPVQVLGLEGHMQSISAGGEMTCATAEDGRAKCWGGDDFSQLGLGNVTYFPTPVAPNESTPAARVIANGWTGAAGSIYTLTGENFSTGNVTMTAEGTPLSGSVPVSAEGSWVAYLTTDLAGEGYFRLVASSSGGGSGQAAVYVNSLAALQPAEGWGANFALPAMGGWIPAAWLWLPLIIR